MAVRDTPWSSLKMAPIDVTFGLSEACKKDSRSPKVNLAIGVYSNDDGSSFVFPVVHEVEKYIAGKGLDKEYAGILGLESFRRASLEFALGSESKAVIGGLCATAQTVAGTSALRVIATFLAKHYPYEKTLYISEYTWPNHAPIFKEAGFSVKSFRYYNWKTGGLDSEGLYQDLKSIPKHSVVLFQACGHNPTGVDPVVEEWNEISKICKDCGHFVVIDNVYQGFASGSHEKDATSIRRLVDDGNNVAICQTFSKNFGLYGERVGTATIVCSSVDEKRIVESHLKLVIRPMYSNPPINGARIATEILTNPQYRNQWLKEFNVVFEDIQSKRVAFHDALVKTGSKRDWSHILRQKGWFCFTSLSEEQVAMLEKDYAIYMSKAGRVPVVALRTSEIGYLANAIHSVMK
ncbi:PREDICTED: aspartate aminotransferase, mitochondrial-like [Amphimedon queenslandica]|uniref:Aspartate aminotransferase, mitochondrial n=1 Tax=Amphimedon queenslandica TaxID=400682 RepID=A0A1X7UF25_AMPQE|nr:PREDICTED: aspartate aminotransferase, mitochondrial-like [Amphimedon queenslandica]|eukprot:XP_011405366.2 PREDICTED: aspartate aminotransferase, mitochondrial-like [Amphimedon queenslandica]